MAFFHLGRDDGDEHAVDGKSQCAHDPLRQNVAEDGAKEGTAAPAEVWQQGEAGKKGPGNHRLTHGHREDLIRDQGAEQKTPDAAEAFIHFLGQRDGHEGVADVDGQLRYQHVQVLSGHQHGGDAGELSGTGGAHQGDERRLPGGKTVGDGDDPEGEGHRQVAEGYRDARFQAVCEIFYQLCRHGKNPFIYGILFMNCFHANIYFTIAGGELQADL